MLGLTAARLAAVLVVAICGGASLLASSADAASPSDLCAGGGRTSPPGADLTDFNAAIHTAEAQLNRGADPAAADRALASLALPTGRLAQADAHTAAAYCSAAGEAARLGTAGSQPLAQIYLLSAFRYADAAGDTATAARAAYRLGLASTTDSASGDVRATRGARQAAAATGAGPFPPTDVNDACRDAVTRGTSRGNRRLARAALACAVTRARAAGAPDLAALAGLRLARLDLTGAVATPMAAGALRQNAAAAALASLADAMRISEGTGRADLLGRDVEAALDAGSDDAVKLRDALVAMRDTAPTDVGVQAFATALEGRMALARGDRSAAAAAFQQAVFLESQRSHPFRLADWLLLLARADPRQRQAHVLEAYRALEAVRPLLPLVDPVTEESTFSLRMQPVFEAAVDVQLSEAASADDPGQIAGAQQIIEAYRQAELQSAFGPNCVPPADPVKPADLRRGEVLLYPVLLDDRVELIYAVREHDGDAPQFQRLAPNRSANRQSVAKLVNEAVYSAGYGGDNAWREPSRRLFDLLIKPIESHLGPNTTLVVVPDGPLRALPFAMLTNAKGEFLIQKTRLAVAPTLSYSQPGRDRRASGLTVVAASLEKEVDLPAGDFPKLDGTAAEARVAFGADGRGRGELIPDFNRVQLSAALTRGRVDVVHLATHAAFNGRSDRSFIVANGEAIPIADLRDMIGKSRARGDQIDLLVLSACETAVGDDQASMGLAGAAVQAGAVSVIASLWEVNDTGTLELMRRFYGAYRGGQGKAAALRTAQLALIDQGGDLAQPNVWAAFTLLGGWR